MTAALWVVGFGLVVLVLLVAVVRRPAARLNAARAALRNALTPRIAALRALAASRRR